MSCILQSWAGPLWGYSNRNRRRKTNKSETAQNKTLGQQRSVTPPSSPAALSLCSRPPRSPRSAGRLWCPLLHKHQHVLNINSVWLCGGTGAERSRPGETPRWFLLLRPPHMPKNQKEFCKSHLRPHLAAGSVLKTFQQWSRMFLRQQQSFSTFSSQFASLWPSHEREVSLQLYARSYQKAFSCFLFRFGWLSAWLSLPPATFPLPQEHSLPFSSCPPEALRLTLPAPPSVSPVALSSNAQLPGQFPLTPCQIVTLCFTSRLGSLFTLFYLSETVCHFCLIWDFRILACSLSDLYALSLHSVSLFTITLLLLNHWTSCS